MLKCKQGEKKLKSKVYMLTMAIIILKKMLGLSAVGNKGLSMEGVANEKKSTEKSVS